MIEKFRIYANAFEIAVQENKTDKTFEGWSDIIYKDIDLLQMVIKMVKNRDNDEGRKIAVLLYKHRKDSVRYIADKIIKQEKFFVEDRSNITL